MKGLRKYLPPFAPDQSGAVSVFYELGGIVVICDAGGCAGNVCGFDEPRWFDRRSAIFSAGLRDMDAILGRDDKLVEKLCDAADKLDARFAAIVGTPVPAVIATDYRGLRRLAEKKTSLPVLTVETTGMDLYDAGQEQAYLALFKRFARETKQRIPDRVGVIGATPLDMSRTDAGAAITAALSPKGIREVWIYGMGAGLQEIEQAGTCERNIVVSPSGLAAAEYLQKRFGMPYEVLDPLAKPPEGDYSGKRILVVHQQATANSLRQLLLRGGAASVDVASWFLLKPALKWPGDHHITEEDEFADLVMQGQYDCLICDRDLWQIVPAFSGEKVDYTHFAVSGRLMDP